MGYILLAIGAVIVSLSVSLFVQTERLDVCKKNNTNLIAEVANKEEQSRLDSKAKELEHNKILGETDVKYQKKLFTLNTTIDELRKQRSVSSSNLPTASNSKSSTVPAGQICFDRAELARAESDSEAAIEEIIISGAKTKLDYSCAIDWADKLNKGEQDGKANIKD